MNPNQRQQLSTYLRDAVLGVLPDKRLAEVQAGNHEELIGSFEEQVVVAIIGFDHPECSGSILLACESEFLAQTLPGSSLKAAQVPLEQIADWLGELSNMILGRFKHSLLQHKLNIRGHPPAISFASPSLIPGQAMRMPSFTQWYEIDEEKICVQFAAEVAADIDFEKAKSAVSNGRQPGEVVATLNPLNRRPGSTSKPKSPAQTQIELSGLSWESKEKVLLSFSNGIEIRLMRAGSQGSRRHLQVAGVELSVSWESEGTAIEIDGLALFLPRSAA